MNLTEARDDQGYIVVNIKNRDLLIQSGNRIRVTTNNGSVVVIRILGNDTRFSVPWLIAKDITIQKAH